MNLTGLCDDLRSERQELCAYLEALDDDQWSTATPAIGWTVLDQVTHLSWFDGAARLAIEEPKEFRVVAKSATSGSIGIVETVARQERSRSGPDALSWLRRATEDLLSAISVCDPVVRVPWYGPDMSLPSLVTARIMETWAHGQDIVDALGIERRGTFRLRHVAFLGWRAVGNSFRAHGRPVPDAPVRVQLGDIEFGPEDAENVVSGPLLDFCLVVTQRRHVSTTDLVAEGPVAQEWLTIAQAFAGPPGAGRPSG